MGQGICYRNSTVAYVIANEGIRENVREFVIKNRVDSNHMPLLLSRRREEAE